jgi:hypothetical protein
MLESLTHIQYFIKINFVFFCDLKPFCWCLYQIGFSWTPFLYIRSAHNPNWLFNVGIHPPLRFSVCLEQLVMRNWCQVYVNCSAELLFCSFSLAAFSLDTPLGLVENSLSSDQCCLLKFYSGMFSSCLMKSPCE